MSSALFHFSTRRFHYNFPTLLQSQREKQKKMPDEPTRRSRRREPLTIFTVFLFQWIRLKKPIDFRIMPWRRFSAANALTLMDFPPYQSLFYGSLPDVNKEVYSSTEVNKNDEDTYFVGYCRAGSFCDFLLWTDEGRLNERKGKEVRDARNQSQRSLHEVSFQSWPCLAMSKRRKKCVCVCVCVYVCVRVAAHTTMAL